MRQTMTCNNSDITWNYLFVIHGNLAAGLKWFQEKRVGGGYIPILNFSD